MTEKVTWAAPDGRVFERVGECPPSRCKGRCCNHMAFAFPANEDSERWAVLHDGVDIQKFGPISVLKVASSCSALSEDRLCSLYGSEERPQACADWPRSPVDLLTVPECGFHFEPLKEAN